MNEAARLARNALMLSDCYSTFALRARRTLTGLEQAGWRPRVNVAWRGPKEQARMVREGKSRILYGFHNVTNGAGLKESLALDLVDDDHPLVPRMAFLAALAREAAANGLETGIRWGLTRAQARVVDAWIRGDGPEPGRKQIGWDPLHIQTSGVTVAQAQMGRRPV